jgi:spore germination cell wall hydrolase CwlJ-like protein
VSKNDLECLALNVYHEARSEPQEGQLAVAAVTLNRVESESFPNSVCAVVKQGGERLHRCQFSWWCDGKSDKPSDEQAWDTALRLSRLSLLGLAPDPTKGALYYHATYVTPRWSRSFERTARIGAHLFYRPRQAEPLQLASLQ